MADAVRLISIRRGYDPREFASSRSAAPGRCTAPRSREDLSIPTVLVPPNPGITSALGCLLVDVRHDLSAMFLAHVDDGRPQAARERVREARGRRRASGSTPRACRRSRCRIQRLVDMRYLGQWRSLTIPVVCARRSRRRPSIASTPSTSAPTTTGATTRPSRSTGSSLRAVGVTPKPELEAARAERRRREAARQPARCASTSSGAAVDTPLYLPRRPARRHAARGARRSSSSSTRRRSCRPGGGPRSTSG